jgi:hypothetical protein
MRLAQHKLLPRNDRSRVRVPENYPAVYLQARRRRRSVPSLESPLDIAGLRLWLDAAQGLTGAWSDVPDGGGAWADYSSSSNYPANGTTHGIRVYAYKTVEEVRVYSANYLELIFTDNNSEQTYLLNWSWSAVGSAEGYRVLKRDTYNGLNFDSYRDVESATSFVDTGVGDFTGGSTVTPWTAGTAGAVTQWDDQSGLDNHATPGGSGCAILQPGVVNGRPVLRFGSAAGYTTPLVLNTPCTVFAAYALNGAGDLARRAVQGSNNWMIGPYGPPHDFFNGGGFTGGPALTRGIFVAQAAWQNGSASRNWLNGAFAGATLGGGGGPGTLGLGIGGVFAEPLDGDLAEVIAYGSALSDTNLARVWNYFAAKYALS